MKKHHPMVDTLLNLKGNPRACVYTEPLWGIPYNLFAPYASVYMYALGVVDKQIGLIASIGMALQVVFSLLGGIITDKLGRKKTTFIFDIIAWSIPCLIWAVAQNFTYFIIAAVINSTLKITANSWTCLLVEDCEQQKIVDIYSWTNISGLLSAFFAPVAGLLIAWYSFIPTVRGLYVLAFIMMTAKFVILNIYATETKQGKVRIDETKHQSIMALLGQYGGVLNQILKSRDTMLSLGIMLVMSICNMVNASFWSILVTKKINIPVSIVGMFPFLRSLVMLLFFFIVIPKIKVSNLKRPIFTGFCTFILSQLLLIFTPEKGYALLVASTLLEALSMAFINPLVDSMVTVTVDPKERARIMSLLYVIVIMLTSPFGWIAGMLSEKSRILPFMMNIILFLIGALLTGFIRTASHCETDADAV